MTWAPYYYQTCERPLSFDCTAFRVTRQWAVACFSATYNRMRYVYGPNLDAISNAIVEAEVPGCGNSNTSAAQEFRRRIYLATAVLLRSEGVDVPMPPAPPGAPRGNTWDQPWLRALLSGWA